jgi:hypothetical protein
LPLLFFVFSTSVLVLSCLYCSGLLLFYCGYVPLVPLFWLCLPRFLHQHVGVVVDEKDNTNMLVEKTKNSTEKRNQNSEASGT